MEFDKTRRSCWWNSAQNCTQNSARGGRREWGGQMGVKAWWDSWIWAVVGWTSRGGGGGLGEESKGVWMGKV